MSKNGKWGNQYFRKQEFDEPEATVKKWIKDVLKEYNVYYLMPVQAGKGATGVDFHCVVNWCNVPLAFFIEAKEFGKEPTDRQALFAEQRRIHQRAKTFIIDGMVGVNQLRAWLEKLEQQTNKHNKKQKLENGAIDGHLTRV
jgi:hypothetical protein